MMRRPNLENKYLRKVKSLNGMPIFLISTLVFFIALFLCSLLFKSNIVDSYSSDSLLPVTTVFYVSPVTGLIAIFIVAIFKIGYDILYYRTQKYMNDNHMKGQRNISIFLYVIFMILYIVLAFIFFNCGKQFLDTYNFNSNIADNIGFSTLFFILPFTYIVILVLGFITGKQTNK